MKKILMLALGMGIAYSAYTQSPVRISGELKTDKKTNVKLYAVKEGKNVEIATAEAGSGNKFGFQFYPKYEGLYCLGIGLGLVPTDSYKFYFKPGDELDIELNDTTYVLKGTKNSKENMVMSKWHDASYQVEKNAVINFRPSYVTFFPMLEALAKTSQTFLKGKETGNVKFDKAMAQLIKSDMALFASNFIMTPRTAHPAKEEYSPFYASLELKDFTTNTTSLYTYPFGSRLFSMLVSVQLKKNGQKYMQGIDGLKQVMEMVPNDTLKGEKVLEDVKPLKNFQDYKAYMDLGGKYILTASQKLRNQEILVSLAQLKKGDQAMEFAYEDRNGKIVKMSDLKGKVVLIDVWATWCGPCKAEIPYLKKLEEEMSGKDVQIVSISVDQLKDKGKWSKMLVDEKLTGTQLFAGGNDNALSKYYKVNTIPRFLVFDKLGKIVSIDAPRPSDVKLKEMLEAELIK